MDDRDDPRTFSAQEVRFFQNVYNYLTEMPGVDRLTVEACAIGTKYSTRSMEFLLDLREEKRGAWVTLLDYINHYDPMALANLMDKSPFKQAVAVVVEYTGGSKVSCTVLGDALSELIPGLLERDEMPAAGERFLVTFSQRDRPDVYPLLRAQPKAVATA